MFTFPITCCLSPLIILLFTAVFLAPLVCAVPHPVLPSLSSLHKAGSASSSLDAPSAVTFAVPCPGCFHEGADAALPFELTHLSSIDCTSALVRLNGRDIALSFQNSILQSNLDIIVADRVVGLSVHGFCNQNQSLPNSPLRQVLFFDVDPRDDTSPNDYPSFTALLDQSAQAPAVVIPHPVSETQCLSSSDELAIAASFFSIESQGETNDVSVEDIDDALERTDVQEESPEDSPVAELHRRFIEERKLIRRLTMDCHEERKYLLDDLRECEHDFKCSGKVLCEHVHDLFVSLMATLKAHLQSSPMVSDERQWQAIIGDEGSPTDRYPDSMPSMAQPAPSHESASPTASPYTPFNKQKKQSAVVIALEILAGALGLAGLLALIRRHCHSIRRRVDRLADREERKRAREYRRLARREAARKRWVTFKAFFRLPCRKGGCEEKRALILEAAAPATGDDGRLADVEQAWDAVFRASPDQLIAGVEEFAREYRVVLAQPSSSSQHGKHGDTRSRSSSLPSYESEKLPEYSSQPDEDVVIIDGYRVYTPSLTDCSTNTGLTPDSSIPDLSPRCSRETLRTLMSRD